MSGNRRRMRAASFGPEWRPFGNMASWLLSNGTPREEVRMRAHLRNARRELTAQPSTDG